VEHSQRTHDASGSLLAGAEVTPPPAGLGKVGRYRWWICALLFFAATINYIDRQVLGILKPTLSAELGWNEIDYSNIVFGFQLAYGIGFILMGRMIDWLGSRRGFSLSVIFWSVAAMAHAGARSISGFIAARVGLGLGEAGNFPASIKTVAEWFPKKERAFATGIFNAGTNIGALVAALMVPWLTLRYGWQVCFLVTGALGFAWVIAWAIMYRQPEHHPRVGAAELAHIQSDPPDKPGSISWRSLLPHRQTWAFPVGKFFSDPIWYVWMFWTADFLNKRFGVSLAELALPLVIIYFATDIGSVGGGWLSSFLLRRGWTANASRKTAMLVCALSVIPVIAAAFTSNLWIAVGVLALATAAHQGWSANLYTIVSDMFPRRCVGSVIGMGGLAGAIGGMMVTKAVGYILQFTGSYLPVFFLAAGAYLFALLLIHLLVPRLEPALVD
jgi:MFS transporter, ACS family, aldohexuronate transporter